MKKVGISVLICTFNRPHLLKKCLSSVLHQETKPAEVVVIEDCSIRKYFSKKLLEDQFPADIRIVYKSVAFKNIAASRNLALKLASYKNVLFVDDDVFLLPNYIKILHTLFKSHKNVVGIAGSIKAAQKNYWQYFSERLFAGNLRGNVKNQKVLFWPTLNLALRKDFLNKHSVQFDEKLKALEDIDFCLQINQKKADILFEHQLCAMHEFRNTEKEFYQSFYGYYRYLRVILQKYPKLITFFPVQRWLSEDARIGINTILNQAAIFYFALNLLRYLKLSPFYFWASLVYYKSLYYAITDK